jgi:hypothetical protein
LTGFDLNLGDGPAGDGAVQVPKLYESGTVTDEFWITIKGPLSDQAKALDRLKSAMADIGMVTVELGTTQSV